MSNPRCLLHLRDTKQTNVHTGTHDTLSVKRYQYSKRNCRGDEPAPQSPIQSKPWQTKAIDASNGRQRGAGERPLLLSLRQVDASIVSFACLLACLPCPSARRAMGSDNPPPPHSLCCFVPPLSALSPSPSPSPSPSHRVGVTEHRVRQGVDARGLAGPGGSADDDVWHVALLGDDLEAVKSLLVPHHLFVGVFLCVFVFTFLEGMAGAADGEVGGRVSLRFEEMYIKIEALC